MKPLSLLLPRNSNFFGALIASQRFPTQRAFYMGFLYFYSPLLLLQERLDTLKPNFNAMSPSKRPFSDRSGNDVFSDSSPNPNGPPAKRKRVAFVKTGEVPKPKAFWNVSSDNYQLTHLEISDVAQYKSLSPDDHLRRFGTPEEFSARRLCAAIENDCSPDTIKWYTSNHDTTLRSVSVSDAWALLYYAAQRNSSELISILLKSGIGHATDKEPDHDVPILAFVVLSGHKKAVDTTEVLKLLLASNLPPTAIPMDMWAKFLETPQPETPNPSVVVPDSALSQSKWCTPKIRKDLAPALHLSNRYLLHLASQLTPQRARMLQIAEANKMLDLTKLPYFLVGQRQAADIVMKRVYSHIALKTKTPLIIAFAGASGHGKTELARAMGDLLSVKRCEIDCAKIHTDFALFGGMAPYYGCEKGSTLNNFLADNSGLRSVVFMDEFDKTSRDIRDALLVTIQSGMLCVSYAWKSLRGITRWCCVGV